MQTDILAFLKELELRHQINIVFASESGSRAWGFPSPDSDYDIRFIFFHPAETYISIFEPKDTITLMEGLLDGSGWDFKKTLQLSAKSNVSVFEWLQSPIVYIDKNNFGTSLWKTILPSFQPKKAIHHYLGIASSTLHHNFQNKKVKLKKYFYVLRPLFSARFIAQNYLPAPSLFKDLLHFYPDEENIANIIEDFLQLKEKAMEGFEVDRNPVLDHFVEKEMTQLLTIAKSMPKKAVDHSSIDHFYRQQLNIQI